MCEYFKMICDDSTLASHSFETNCFIANPSMRTLTICHNYSLQCPATQCFQPDSRLAVKLAAVNSYLAGFIGI